MLVGHAHNDSQTTVSVVTSPDQTPPPVTLTFSSRPSSGWSLVCLTSSLSPPLGIILIRFGILQHLIAGNKLRWSKAPELHIYLVTWLRPWHSLLWLDEALLLPGINVEVLDPLLCYLYVLYVLDCAYKVGAGMLNETGCRSTTISSLHCLNVCGTSFYVLFNRERGNWRHCWHETDLYGVHANLYTTISCYSPQYNLWHLQTHNTDLQQCHGFYFM